jgi:Cu+-exporting ATPase
MTCGNCALTITKMLEKNGASKVSVIAATGDVSFALEEETDVDKVFDAIDEIGYHVVRAKESEAHNHDHDPHHGHDHGHGHGDTDVYFYVCVGLTLLLLLHMVWPIPLLHSVGLQVLASTPVFAIGWFNFGKGAFNSLRHGMPNMNVLILLGSSAAYIYSWVGILVFPTQAHNYLFFETTASIITLVMMGNWLEHRTVKATTHAIDELVHLQPQTAKLLMVDSLGKETLCDIESKFVRNGDILQVNHGDTVPVDGIVLSGNALADENMISGESVPLPKMVGDSVIGGTLLQEGNLRIKATAVGNASVLANIIRLVREAQSVKPPLQKLADKISAIFVPLVAGISLLTFLLNYFVFNVDITNAIMRAIAVLVISCPCAMGLATPAAIAVGLGRAARMGILIKGAETLEQFKKIKYLVFDKTGTLTLGHISISNCHVESMNEEDFKAIVSAMERFSSHPIARSLLRQWPDNGNISFQSVTERKGMGVSAIDAEGRNWHLGSEQWLHTNANNNKGYDLYLYRNNEYIGAIKLQDSIRPDAKATIHVLHAMGYKTILLSGDKEAVCQDVANQLGIPLVYARQSPEQKHALLDKLMKEAPTAMVGDGINDAPALARATIGISLSESSQIAMQSANVILSKNKLSSLPAAIRLGILTEQTIKQNLFWAFIYNIIAIPFAAMGYLSPLWGAGIMGLSDVVLVLNSIRLRFRKL